MRTSEAGFTLPEMVVTVGVALMLLAAGGAFLLGMRPGALANARDDFDANLAAAKAIAGSSGKGATLVFAPRTGGASGFTLRVYAGRPNASNALSVTTVPVLVSAASVSETHFGAPPFAIFLSSAGYPTGVANYPSLDANGNATFTTIAQQPRCPNGGIELTFTNPQGVTATRTLPCDTIVAVASTPQVTPTPNAPHVSPTYLLAHDTTDSAPLRFKAAEYGYFHWYASTANGAACQTISSDTGAAPAVFASPWPYAQPSPSAQSALAPAPPAFAPYTWPAGDPNDPPAWFVLSPVLHNGGMCTLAVADDYGQSGGVTVQVMGDLTPSTTSLSFTIGGGAQTIDFSKTFDSEKLLLSVGGPCLGIVTAATASGTYPSTPSRATANASVTVTPVSQGACTLLVQDQYGERVALGLTVTRSDFDTWPATLVVGAGGASVGTTTGGVEISATDTSPLARVAPILNALLGGGIARAATYSGACYSRAFGANGSSADTSLPASVAADLGVSVTTDGCILNSNGSAPYGGSTPTGVMVAYEPVGSGQTGNFTTTIINSNCVQLGPWNPADSGAQTSLSATGSASGKCDADFSDGNSTQTPAADAGQVAVEVDSCLETLTSGGSGTVAVGTSVGCIILPTLSVSGGCGGTQGGTGSGGTDTEEYVLAFNDDATSATTLTTTSSYGTLDGTTFTRTAAGAVPVYVYVTGTIYETKELKPGEPQYGTVCQPSTVFENKGAGFTLN